MSTTSDNPISINQLPVSIEMPRDYEEFREIGSLLFKRIVDGVNKKTGSLYYPQEIGNFNSYFTSGKPYQFRNVYRYVFDLVALNGGNITGGSSVTFAHGITSFVNGTLIYASCTDTTGLSFTATYPYSSMDATNIYFTNPEPATDLTAAYFVGEYTKT